MSLIYRNGNLIAGLNVEVREQIFVKYADDINGTNMTATWTDQEYIGQYTGETDSDDPTDYIWAKFVGETGPQGPQGPQGESGVNANDYYGNKITEVVEGKYIDNSTGAEVENVGYCYFKIPVVPKQMIWLKDLENAGFVTVSQIGAFFDSNGDFVSSANRDNTGNLVTTSDGKIRISIVKNEANITEFRANALIGSKNSIIAIDNLFALNKEENKLDSFVLDDTNVSAHSDCFKFNEVNQEAFFDGAYYMISQGICVGETAAISMLPPLDIEGYDEIHFKGNDLTNMSNCGRFVDEDFNYISSAMVISKNMVINIPANAKWLMPHFLTSDKANVELYRVKNNPSIKINEHSLTKNQFLNGKKWCSLGDSITYQYQWQDDIVSYFNGLIHINCGLGSSALAGSENNTRKPYWTDIRLGLGDYASDLTETIDSIEVGTVIPNDPDIVTIWGGANDTLLTASIGTNAELSKILADKDKTTFYGAYSYIIETLLTWKSGLRIILITQPYFVNNTTIENYNNATREVAQYYGLPLVDLYREAGINKMNTSLYYADTIHPNAKGGYRVSERIIAEFKKMISISYTE